MTIYPLEVRCTSGVRLGYWQVEGPHISLVTYEKVGLIFRQSSLLSFPDCEVLCSSGEAASFQYA